MPTEALLLEQRSAALAQITLLEAELAAIIAASADSNADDEHDPEGSTIAFERAKLQALLDAARVRLTAVEVAIGRCAGGTYGVCEGCGAAIGDERLAARPAATRCVGCAPRRR